jgi:phosphatidylethanolamine/phosphatidyl-N-methylethanolamine N-methyltransferase
MPQTKVRYDDLAPRYERVMRPLERWFLTRWRAETLAHLPPHSRILEVGAGTGLNFRFYPRGATGVASELSREMLNIAKGKGKPEKLSLAQSNAEMLPFPAATFDAAFATLVFCSVASPAQAFAELHRVVKPGGSIVLLEHVRPPGLLGPAFDLLNLLTVWLLDDNCNRRTAEMAQAVGFRVLTVDRRLQGIFNLIVLQRG